MKNKIHYVDNSLINPTNPVTINVIGSGGTGSNVLTSLCEMNHSLIELGHPGLQVNLWDDDIVTSANQGRQKFAKSEIGFLKSISLINRVNRFYGTHWKAKEEKYSSDYFNDNELRATITISCVDNNISRFEIADILQSIDENLHFNAPKYWIDFGNSKNTGQVIISTVSPIPQNASDKFIPVDYLPLITDEFKDGLISSEIEDTTPSCSLKEALQKQDLFVNSVLARLGCSLLWKMFRNGFILKRGLFMNLETLRVNPLKI